MPVLLITTCSPCCQDTQKSRGITKNNTCRPDALPEAIKGYSNQPPFLEKAQARRTDIVMLITINPINPQARLIEKVVDCLKSGGVIAYPTDTYYGIGCDIMNKKAIEKVYALKKRDKNKPFSFICSDLKHINDFAKVTNSAYRTLKRCLPGPYTFILEGTKLVPKIMLTKRRTAGIRVPDNLICMAIIQALGNPIISTSATLLGDEPMPDAWMIEESFPTQIDMVIDGGPVPNKPSSVISLMNDEPEILREGAGPVDYFKI